MVPKPETQSPPPHILVVEDEVLVRAVLADQLRVSGFSVIEASRADEALAYLRAGGPADLLFSDIQMPGSLNGLQLARQVRQDFPAVPIILTSGNIRARDTEDLGLFIPKPYDLEDAAALVHQALGLEPPEGAE
jgi:CheY-like chemotaxis protein